MSSGNWMPLIVLYIRWDAEHTSPPIGIFEGQTEANKAAKELRKRLKAHGIKAHGAIRMEHLRTMGTARSWLPLEGEEDPLEKPTLSVENA